MPTAPASASAGAAAPRRKSVAPRSASGLQSKLSEPRLKWQRAVHKQIDIQIVTEAVPAST